MFGELLDKLVRREDLTDGEAEAAMHEIMEGRATEAQMAGLLVGLAMKGERPREVAGLARAMRARSVKLPAAPPEVVDVCGTGGDRSGTFNISSAAAVVVAACGTAVAKHGNRAVSSGSGSADVFDALGVSTSAPPAVVGRCLNEAGLAFLFAPVFHPSMKHAAGVRRELGLRTAFNLLGPLTNPAGPTRQLVGVSRAELTELMARVLLILGSERSWVVHGADGLDEISVTGYSKISECFKGTVRTFYVHPHDFGLPVATLADLGGGNAAVNAGICRSVLGGARGPARDVVVLNAGAALFVAGRAASVREGIERAAAAIDTGAASRTLECVARLSRGEEAARDSHEARC